VTAGAFEALGHATRRRIVEVLTDGEQAASAIVAAVQSDHCISQPAVSQHLKVLLDARLVTVRAEGTHRIYALDPAGVDAAQAWLAHVARATDPFAQPLDALATEVERGRRRRRAGDESTRGSRSA
jgi:DNA-binding transcriptional ArsR family regulator